MLQPSLSADTLLQELVIECEERVTLRHVNNLVLPGNFHNAEERLDLRFQPSLVVEDVALGILALKMNAQLGDFTVDFVSQMVIDSCSQFDALFLVIPVVGVDGIRQTARGVNLVTDGEAHVDGGRGNLVTTLRRNSLIKF